MAIIGKKIIDIVDKHIAIEPFAEVVVMIYLSAIGFLVSQTITVSLKL